jgi:hypothetical protein
MLIAMPLVASTPVKAEPVNCEPWSVLKMSPRLMFRAFACLAMARSCAGSIIALRSVNLLPSGPSKKSFSSVSSPMRLPRRDLIGVDVELLRELSQGSIALQGRKRHLRLEGRRVVPARRLFMVSPDSLGTACPLSGRNSTYRLVQISETSSHNQTPATRGCGLR